ncbi:D-alanyl-D-alanine carboxypeptidase family protein [Alteribacillus sp. HJP-4]|uniref:D-alanyl-D-alanine carboxypeptidase family protein n=1 Tax=Alteribacillus sp. HJP-4 TaxID=2775394 RepID=UPI0035CD336B
MAQFPRTTLILILPILLITSITLIPFTASAADSEQAPSLYSETAVLMDAETGQILYGKDASRQMSPASITKIASGILALEQGKLEDSVKISEEAANVEGSTVYLLEEEEMQLEQLIQGMLINSGNDAGTAIAEHIYGSEEEFSAEMTRYLEEETGIENTNFTNPHGLYGEDHYTTAEDMARITRYAMENEAFREIVATKELDWEGAGWETTLRNHHQLLWDYEGATGVKNGYVSQAGFTLVTTADRDGRELIAVVMKAGSNAQAYEDTQDLLNFGFDEFEKQQTGEEQTILSPDGTEFIIPEDFTYLKKPGAETSFEIEDDGNMAVVDVESSEHIYELQLELSEDVKPEEKQSAAPQQDSKEEKNDESFFVRNWSEFGYIMADIIRYQVYFWRN